MKRSRTRPRDLARGSRFCDACPCVGDDNAGAIGCGETPAPDQE